jgi:UDP-N-acetylglucosamine pyrophosphorylase
MNYEQIKKLLEEKEQTQLLKYYDELDEQGKAKLLSAIAEINWSFEDDLKNPVDMSGKDRDIRPISGLRLADIEKRKSEFKQIGVNAIKEGKVAAVLLAGGMGTRLGVDGPKGAYDIGLTKPLYIFEQQMKNLAQVNEKCGVRVPLYIMTSDKNHEQTTSFWKEHAYFGYAETADGCQITIKAPSGVAYMKLSVFSSEIGTNPMIAVNEDIRFAYRGYMADGILVKSKNVEGLEDKIRAIVAEMIGT